MLNNYILIVFIGFLVGLALIFLLKKFAFKNKLLMPQGVPLIGGIALALAFMIMVKFGFDIISRETAGIIIASLLMLVFGVIDDWRELSIVAKFLVQIIATTILIFFGIRTHIVYIGDLLNIIITFIWVLGIMNALNHLDVMDGLAGEIALITSSALFVISLLNNDIRTAILALALIGPLISFLIYNLPPAKIYMGNSGSHFLGFVLAAIAMTISYAPMERKVALISPLLILGFPIFDTAFLILMRISKKKLPFKKSYDHLALRFLALGHSKRKALLAMFSLCLFFCISGVLVSKVSNFLGVTIIALVVLVSIVVTRKMSKVAIDG